MQFMQMDCDGNVIEETDVSFDDEEGCMGYSTDVIIFGMLACFVVVMLASYFTCRVLRKAKTE